MPTITFVAPDGTRKDVSSLPGDSVMLAATSNDLQGIIGECGGNLICGSCHVFLEPGDLARFAPPGALEESLLNVAAVPRRATSRLSCQLSLNGEAERLTVHLPERQW